MPRIRSRCWELTASGATRRGRGREAPLSTPTRTRSAGRYPGTDQRPGPRPLEPEETESSGTRVHGGSPGRVVVQRAHHTAPASRARRPRGSLATGDRSCSGCCASIDISVGSSGCRWIGCAARPYTRPPPASRRRPSLAPEHLRARLRACARRAVESRCPVVTLGRRSPLKARGRLLRAARAGAPGHPTWRPWRGRRTEDRDEPRHEPPDPRRGIEVSLGADGVPLKQEQDRGEDDDQGEARSHCPSGRTPSRRRHAPAIPMTQEEAAGPRQERATATTSTNGRPAVNGLTPAHSAARAAGRPRGRSETRWAVRYRPALGRRRSMRRSLKATPGSMRVASASKGRWGPRRAGP